MSTLTRSWPCQNVHPDQILARTSKCPPGPDLGQDVKMSTRTRSWPGLQNVHPRPTISGVICAFYRCFCCSLSDSPTVMWYQNIAFWINDHVLTSGRQNVPLDYNTSKCPPKIFRFLHIFLANPRYFESRLKCFGLEILLIRSSRFRILLFS